MLISQCSTAFQMKNAKLLHSVWIDLEDHGEEPELPSIFPGLQDNRCVVRIPQDPKCVLTAASIDRFVTLTRMSTCKAPPCSQSFSPAGFSCNYKHIWTHTAPSLHYACFCRKHFQYPCIYTYQAIRLWYGYQLMIWMFQLLECTENASVTGSTVNIGTFLFCNYCRCTFTYWLSWCHWNEQSGQSPDPSLHACLEVLPEQPTDDEGQLGIAPLVVGRQQQKIIPFSLAVPVNIPIKLQEAMKFIVIGHYVGVFQSIICHLQNVIKRYSESFVGFIDRSGATFDFGLDITQHLPVQALSHPACSDDYESILQLMMEAILIAPNPEKNLATFLAYINLRVPESLKLLYRAGRMTICIYMVPALFFNFRFNATNRPQAVPSKWQLWCSPRIHWTTVKYKWQVHIATMHLLH